MAESESSDNPLDAPAAEPEGMIDERGELPTWDLFEPSQAQRDATALAPVTASQEVQSMRRRSGARWGAVGMLGGLAGILVGLVAQFAFASGPGLAVGILVAIVSITLIGLGYFRFWSSGRN